MDSLQNDMQLLLESLKFLNEDKGQQIQALKTLATMCNEKDGASYMYKHGGLKTITNIFCNTQSSDVKQFALYGLSNAVQCHVPSKKLLCIPEMMKKIRLILASEKNNYLVHVAANFLLSLASDYAPAQDLARKENCLQALLELYSSSIPKSDVWFDGVGKSSNNLWMIVSSALCNLMSEPQNETNQILSTKVLPQAISTLKNSRSDVIISALNFIGHCISDNKKTQRTLQLVGGLHALVNLLKKYSNSDGEKEAKLLENVLKTISYAVTDYADNKEAVGSLSIVSIILDILRNQHVCPAVLASGLICLSLCIDECATNRAMLFEKNGVKILISILIAAEDEEVRKIVLYLLRGCLPLSQGKLEVSDKDLLSRVLQSDCSKLDHIKQSITSIPLLPTRDEESNNGSSSKRNKTSYRDELRTPNLRNEKQIATPCKGNSDIIRKDTSNDPAYEISIKELVNQNTRLMDLLLVEKGITPSAATKGTSPVPYLKLVDPTTDGYLSHPYLPSIASIDAPEASYSSYPAVRSIPPMDASESRHPRQPSAQSITRIDANEDRYSSHPSAPSKESIDAFEPRHRSQPSFAMQAENRKGLTDVSDYRGPITTHVKNIAKHLNTTQPQDNGISRNDPRYRPPSRTPASHNHMEQNPVEKNVVARSNTDSAVKKVSQFAPNANRIQRNISESRYSDFQLINREENNNTMTVVHPEEQRSDCDVSGYRSLSGIPVNQYHGIKRLRHADGDRQYNTDNSGYRNFNCTKISTERTDKIIRKSRDSLVDSVNDGCEPNSFVPINQYLINQKHGDGRCLKADVNDPGYRSLDVESTRNDNFNRGVSQSRDNRVTSGSSEYDYTTMQDDYETEKPRRLESDTSVMVNSVYRPVDKTTMRNHSSDNSDAQSENNRRSCSNLECDESRPAPIVSGKSANDADKIMKMLQQQEQILQSVNKRIDDLQFDKQSRCSERSYVHSDDPISPNNRHTNVDMSIISSNIAKNQQSSVVRNQRRLNRVENANINEYDSPILGISNDSPAIDKLTSRGHSSDKSTNLSYLPQNISSNHSTSKICSNDGIFKIPSQNLSSVRRTVRKKNLREQSTGNLTRSSSLMDLSKDAVVNTPQGYKKIASMVDRGTHRYRETASPLGKGCRQSSIESSVKQKRFLDDPRLAMQNRRNEGNDSIESVTPLTGAAKHNVPQVRANAAVIEQVSSAERSTSNGKKGRINEETLSSRLKRKIQLHGDSINDPSTDSVPSTTEISFPRNAPLRDRKDHDAASTVSTNYPMNTTNPPEQKSLHVQASGTHLPQAKDILVNCSKSSLDTVSEWINSSENDFDVISNSTHGDSEKSLFAVDGMKTPLPAEIEDDVLPNSRSVDLYTKTPSDMLPTRMSKKYPKVKRHLAFSAEASSATEDNQKTVSAPYSTPSSRDTMAKLVSPAIVSTNPVFDDNTPPDKDLTENGHKCLGCYPFSRFPFFVVNSRNCSSALQKDQFTCDFHKNLLRDNSSSELNATVNHHNRLLKGNFSEVNRQLNVSEKVQKYLASCNGSAKSSVKSVKPSQRILEVNGEKKELEETSGFSYISELDKRSESSESVTIDGALTRSVEGTVTSKRRKRKDYTDVEIENILRGVRRHGKRWNAILYSYQFKQGRTASDLKDKYKQICKKRKRGRMQPTSVAKPIPDAKPFTAQEIVNLKTGYGRYGARWKTILNNFKFQRERTATELQRKYERVLTRF